MHLLLECSVWGALSALVHVEKYIFGTVTLTCVHSITLTSVSKGGIGFPNGNCLGLDDNKASNVVPDT